MTDADSRVRCIKHYYCRDQHEGPAMPVIHPRQNKTLESSGQASERHRGASLTPLSRSSCRVRQSSGIACCSRLSGARWQSPYSAIQIPVCIQKVIIIISVRLEQRGSLRGIIKVVVQGGKVGCDWANETAAIRGARRTGGEKARRTPWSRFPLANYSV